MPKRACAIAGTAFAAVWLSAGAAAARDVAYCVTCQGPVQTYLCRVTGADLPKSDALKLYCVIRSAKEGGHASCGARDDAAGCNGIPREYSYTGPELPSGFAVREEAPAAGAPTPLQGAAEPERRGPKTVVEAIGASRRGLRNVRESLRGSGSREESLPAAPSETQLPELPAEFGAPPPAKGDPASVVTSQPPAEPAANSASVTSSRPPAEPSEANPDKPKTALGRGVKTMGSFARSSYRCMRSLFRKCGEEQDQAVDRP